MVWKLAIVAGAVWIAVGLVVSRLEAADWGSTMGEPYRLYSPSEPPVYDPMGRSPSPGVYDPVPDRGVRDNVVPLFPERGPDPVLPARPVKPRNPLNEGTFNPLPTRRF